MREAEVTFVSHPSSSAPMATPCVKRCAVHPTHRLCTGCGRSLQEITGWASMSASERQRIMSELAGRLARAAAPAGC
ncbi:DUF1289 domain-containing protein [Xanthobacter variabilis]|uniref:DUF1289 domain-containing protein n=1 Tax=Xanthobacter variabilis TaxID=3119932 RepID=UPI00374E8E00